MEMKGRRALGEEGEKGKPVGCAGIITARDVIHAGDGMSEIMVGQLPKCGLKT